VSARRPERIYEEARRQGHTASLLDAGAAERLHAVGGQHRARPKQVDIEITYFHTLPFDDGWFAYVFPMVVGPRYIPGTPTAAPIAAVAPRGATFDQVHGRRPVPRRRRSSPASAPRTASTVSVAVDAGVPAGRRLAARRTIVDDRATVHPAISAIVAALRERSTYRTSDLVLRLTA
jgi:Ca-activated chloride channel family protein